MTRTSSTLTRAARLTSGVVLLLSFVLPMHGAGHALHTGHGGGAGVTVHPDGGHRAQEEQGEHGTPGGEGAHREPGGEGGPHGPLSPDHPGEGAAAGPVEPADDPHSGAPASCCTGPCVCPPVRSGPSARSVVVRITVAPIRTTSWRRVAQAPPQPPIPHILPFSTAPPGPV
jgi:hypothetical protein